MAARATAKDISQNPKKSQVPARDLEDPTLYVNRELGLLSFQWRVLEEAQDASHPLLERVKFLAIVGSNLNEFFMVRVASLNAQLDAGIAEFGPDALIVCCSDGGEKEYTLEELLPAAFSAPQLAKR